MNLMNLTPHEIRIYNEDEQHVLTVPPSGIVARIEVETVKRADVDGIPIFKTLLSGLPYYARGDEMVDEPHAALDTVFIVSGLFRSYHPRFDFYQPGRLLRDEDGKPIGCVGLSQ